MEHLPIPRLRLSWIAATIITVGSFFAYYLIFFPYLLYAYQRQFYTPSYKDSNIEINLKIPRHIYSAGPVLVFISATNTSDDVIKDMGVYLISDIDNKSSPLVLPYMYDKDRFSTGIVFDEIAPHSTVSGRTVLLVQSDTKLSQMSIVLNSISKSEPLSGEIPTLTQWKWRALQHSFIETILLPPWSNGLIFVLAMFSSYLANRKNYKSTEESGIPVDCGTTEENEPELFGPGWSMCLRINFTWSAIVMSAIVFLIMVFLVDWLFFVAIYMLLLYLLVMASRPNISYVFTLTLAVTGASLLVLSLAMFFDNPSGLWGPSGFELGIGEALVYDIALTGMTILSFIVAVLSLRKYVTEKHRAKTIEDHKRMSGENNLSQAHIFDSPAKPSLHSNENNLGEKEREKKKVNGFETYDLRVEQRIKKEWVKIKKGKDIGDEELALRVFAMQLETKRYYETDWVWRVRNFFRPRSDRLQELLDKIRDRIDELEEEKQSEKEKTVKPIDKLPENGDVPALNDKSDPADPLSGGMPSQPDLGKGTDQDEQAGEDKETK